jgi:hypothetical protein
MTLISSWTPTGPVGSPRRDPLVDEKTTVSNFSGSLTMVGAVFRALFVAALAAIILRVSMPQSSTIWSVYQSPLDLIRMVLGLIACVGIVFKIFAGAKDKQRDQTWIYLGLAAVPFAFICLFATW